MGRKRALITDRDQALLSFAAQHRLVLASHIQVLLGVSPDAARARLRTLQAGGLLGCERFFHGQPRCWWITRKGLAVIGSRLPPPRLDLRSYRHDVGLAWVWLAAERGAFGPLRELISERTMRSHDGAAARSALDPGRAEEPFGVRLGGAGPAGRERLHYPDLLLVTPDSRRIGVELELTGKERARREQILSGYASDPRIDAVLYLVDRPAVARAVEASAARLGIGAIVQVQRARWDTGRQPRPGLAAVRWRERSSDTRDRAGALENGHPAEALGQRAEALER
jgi:hypothetical protein